MQVHQTGNRAAQIGASDDSTPDITVGNRADESFIIVNDQGNLEGGIVNDSQGVENAGVRLDQDFFE